MQSSVQRTFKESCSFFLPLGILMIVQDFNDMTVLQSYLSSETGASNSIRGNRMKCARGIVHGMGFLSSQEVS